MYTKTEVCEYSVTVVARIQLCRRSMPRIAQDDVIMIELWVSFEVYLHGAVVGEMLGCIW